MNSAKTALKLIFRTPRYSLTVFGAAALFIFLVTFVVYSSAVMFTLRYSKPFAVPGNLLQVIWLNNSTGSLAILLVTALLVGINVALMTFLIKQRMATLPTKVTGLLGTFLGLIGVGCASCGSVALSAVLGFSATASLTSVLPWRGTELRFLAIGMLLISIVLTSKKITTPVTCSVK